MKDADEINKAFELGMQVRLRPSPGRQVGKMACLEKYSETTRLLSPIRGYYVAARWASRWQPTEYTFNLMPGLPLWLFWRWERMGVPTTAVMRTNQITAYLEMARVLDLAVERADRIIEVENASERDELVRKSGTVLTSEHVIQGLSPED